MSGKNNKKDEEPYITVNGVALDNRQAMTVRVALQSFAMDLDANGLGDDEHGKFMAKSYVERVREINGMIAKGWKP